MDISDVTSVDLVGLPRRKLQIQITEREGIGWSYFEAVATLNLRLILQTNPASRIRRPICRRLIIRSRHNNAALRRHAT